RLTTEETAALPARSTARPVARRTAAQWRSTFPMARPWATAACSRRTRRRRVRPESPSEDFSSFPFALKAEDRRRQAGFSGGPNLLEARNERTRRLRHADRERRPRLLNVIAV